VISQDEVVPQKLANYLDRHPEIETKLGKSGARRFCVTDITSANIRWAEQLMGGHVQLERIELAP
jgi:glutamate racemase